MADPWDTGYIGNGFTFRAGLDGNHYDNIFGFTLGNIKFLSIGARNLQDVVETTDHMGMEIDKKSKKVKNLLTISAPPDGDIIKWLNKLKDPKSGLDKLRIYIYSEAERAIGNFNTVLVFHGIKQVGKEVNPKIFGVIPMPTALFYTFEYNSPVEIVGQRA
jgi:hypothetical protein